VSGTSDGVVVVTGEALIDLVLAPDGSLAGHPGGGPYNVARTIGRLEQRVTYLGRLSTDAFGRRLRSELDADGVALDAVVPTDTPTTLALAELDADGGAQYEFYDVGTSAPGLTLEEATSVLPEQLGVLYVGTLGLVFEPMATTLEALVRRVGDGTLVALDPNCRPSMIDDPAAYRSRLARLLARTDVVKASEDDLAWLEPGADPVDAARRLLGRDGAVALVTLGSRGALVVTADAVRELPSPVVEVVDTIGAGDAFMGGFLACWRRNRLGRADLRDLDQVAEAGAFACEVAAITCARAGADPPRLHDVR
jgi:fructokinase